jgi:hypothetical protein
MATTATDSVFSEFEVKKLSFKFDGMTSAMSVPCVGSIEEECEVRKVVKKCRGVVRKRSTRGTGCGTVKVSVHMPYRLFVAAFGMELDTLADNVFAYGENSVHPSGYVAVDVFDEDGNEKLRAYPNIVASSGPARKTTNGEEEVAEVELEFEFSPDDYGNGVYETSPENAKTLFGSTDAFFTAFDEAKMQLDQA